MLAHLVLIFLFCFFGLITGCQSIDLFQPKLTPPPVPDTKKIEVKLAPGDEIEIKFFYVPELNDIQKIRPDGKISLQLVGEILAQGKTPLELKNELTSLYESELQKPEVAVIVRSLTNQRVYVGGEVFNPTMIELSGSITPLQAIMQAGGFNMERANVEKVVVIRHKDGKRLKKFINYKNAYEGKENIPEIYLQPNDIVYVPQTAIAKINQWIDQHINKIIPFGTTVTTVRGSTTYGVTPPGGLR